MNQLLTDKHAVIYGGGGSIGAGVARTFAREGAHVYLVGRSAEPLQEHLKSLPRLDVSFNLVSRGDVQGRPLHELSVEEVMAPLQGMRSTLITARAAARRMLEPGAGVIPWLSSGSVTA
jgi:NAD(P)-dependent dehydrogenase (short-subunit alcohol dehydrogenase family)